MIHTCKFYVELLPSEINRIKDKFDMDLKFVSQYLNNKFTGISSFFPKRYGIVGFEFVCDFIKLLDDKPNIDEGDYIEMHNKLNKYCKYVVEKEFESVKLIRIDYRIDLVLINKRERELLIKLYKKSFEIYGFKKKYNKFKTTVYFNTKSTQVAIYDKEEERKKNKEKIEKYEENVLRIEVRLLNKHLNYMKHKNNVEKQLQAYFQNERMLCYFRKNVQPLVFTSDYWNINKATNIINKSSYSEKDKMKLREFLIDISQSNISAALNKTLADEVTKKYSKYTFKKYIDISQKLNINPILIPKGFKGISELKNPLRNYFKL